MAVYRVEVLPLAEPGQPARDSSSAALLREAGLTGVTGLLESRMFFLEGGLARDDAQRIAANLLADPLTETAAVLAEGQTPAPVDAGCVAFEVHLRPGVMDPVAESTLAELHAEGLPVDAVRTARRFVVSGDVRESEVLDHAARTLANACMEQLVPGTAGVQPTPRPPIVEFELRHVALLALDDEALKRLSRDGHLFLSIEEMRAIQAHYRGLEREPTDLELETLAQTWSEHCVHKTLRSAVVYRGMHMPLVGGDGRLPPQCGEETRHYDNLLEDTIVRATKTLIAAGRGPQCLSIFQDNAGVIAFDDELGLAFKVETHNHPSAIEPYGGAATGAGGVIRDVIGCGLGARPIANTDVFCVARSDWPDAHLPKGVLHPRRVLRGVVRGVADYGNRMGIPTVNGAVYFDPRYLGNPLVFCGCVGLIPRDMVSKQAHPGDLIVVLGGRTGRDGIHGATFSSAELTDTHADEFSHAVQIGNAIAEKRFLDALLQARDAEGGCLYSAITDCGAGGLSSAVGEMGEQVGAVVALEHVPLKYAGLRYDEIWISEAQERMVVAVPPSNLDRLLGIMRAEEVEATVIGTFGNASGPQADAAAQLTVRYAGRVVGDLDMRFLHRGVPKVARVAHWHPTRDSGQTAVGLDESMRVDGDALSRVRRELRRPSVASKAWIIRQYDHEVQGGSVVKPLAGPGRGPADAAVLRPRLTSERGVAIGCGLAPHLGDVDPYWMAVASIDEALRNVVCVGGDPGQTAILDNFCWGCCDDPEPLGALVRTCQACHDAAVVYGLPFISGKDSLNNEFVLDEDDVPRLLEILREWAQDSDIDARRLRLIQAELENDVQLSSRLVIPRTLLISALSIVPDVRRCVTPDFKQPGHPVLLVGGFPSTGFALTAAAVVHAALADLISAGLLAACHDVSDGGWLVALAEMAIAGRRGVELSGRDFVVGPFSECCAGYVVEPVDVDAVIELLKERDIRHAELGVLIAEQTLRCGAQRVDVDELNAAWSGDGCS